MVWVLVLLLVFGGVIAFSSGGGIKAGLAGAWGVMGLFAVGAVLWAIIRAFAR
jgi:hypothetical protein